MISTIDIRALADALIAAKQGLDREVTRTTDSQRRRIEIELNDALVVMRKAVLVLREIKEGIDTK